MITVDRDIDRGLFVDIMIIVELDIEKGLFVDRMYLLIWILIRIACR